jgi:hypothetical protein
MTVNSHLTSLASELILSEAEKTSISTSIKTLSSRLNLYFGDLITSQFQFGSSTRATILPRRVDSRSDIDYMVVFNISTVQYKPQTYLNYLKNFVGSKYSTSEICQSHPTIVLSLNHINFELVPAIYNYGYHIPSPASSWLEWMNTNPSTTNQLLEDKNKSNNYRIKPLVRLIKYWNTRNGHRLSSFSIEEYIVSRSFFGCTSLEDYFYSFWEGFSCTYDTAEYIKNMVNSAKQSAKTAKAYQNNNQPVLAELEIRKIVP